MADKIKKTLLHIFSQRSLIILAIIAVLFIIVIVRLFQLQIINGKEYADSFANTTTKTRVLKSTRGKIYDVNGKLLAYNELANSVTLEDNGSYDTRREKSLSLNGEIYRLTEMILSNGDVLNNDFHITLDENDNYVFDCEEGTTRDRFRADIYGHKTIEELTPEEAASTPDEIMELLCSTERFSVFNDDKPYTEEELASHGLPTELTKSQILNIVRIRYQLMLTSYQRYLQVTVASNVCDETVAQIMENSDTLQGVSIKEDSIRVYNYPESMSHIIGYTGKASSEELEELLQERDDYTGNSIIGKAGIEQYMETTLQGTDGSEEVAVDNLGTELTVYEDSIVQPQQGDDVYLTIDAELQDACYKLLEQRIAGIILTNIIYEKEVPEKENEEDDSDIPIPIYDVYHAFINNNVLDIDHFSAEDASYTEADVYAKYTQKAQSVISWIQSEVLGTSSTVYEKMDKEHQAYIDYLVESYLMEEMNFIVPQGDYEEDETYQDWINGKLSLNEFLDQCIQKNWIDLTVLFEDSTYMDSNEILNTLAAFLGEELPNDKGMAKVIYKYMLLNDIILPFDIIQMLYDQGILDKEDGVYTNFQLGIITPDNLITEKIRTLEIKPKQLALDPCSGSIVICDPETGAVRVNVSYPGYDNNRLANNMDSEYYNALSNDLSTPFYNKATQQLTAPGSTYKPVMAAAGLNEGIVEDDTLIECTGLFGEGLVEEGDQLHCTKKDGHGDLNVVGAIENSCNVYFCTLGFELGLNENGVYESARSLNKIQEYTAMFNLDQKTNIELPEASPRVTDSLAIPSSIGQGTHLYTTTQLARFAATIYEKGRSYDLTLLDKVTDSDGTTLIDYTPNISQEMYLSENIWTDIHTGMRLVCKSKDYLKDLPIEIYGKTGTAQESKTRPDHALFIGFTDDNKKEDISFAIRIAYGYSSTNAVLVASDVMSYYYDLKDEATLINGEAATEGLSSIVTD